MSKQILFRLLFFFIVLYSCKNDKPHQEQELTNTNFLINEKNPKKAWEEFEPYSDTIAIKQDDNLAVKVRVGEEVVFKDASEPSNAVSDREWDFDMDAEPNSSEQIAKFTFQSPGLYEVKLSVNGKYNVSKMILALGPGDENIISVNQVAKVEDLNKINTASPQPTTTTTTVVAPPQKASTSNPQPVSKPTMTQATPSQATPSQATNSVIKPSNPAPAVASSPKPQPTNPMPSTNNTKVESSPVKPNPPISTTPKEIAKTTPAPPTSPTPISVPPKKEEAKSVPPPVTSNTSTAKLSEPEFKAKGADRAGANSKNKGVDEGGWVDRATAVLTPQVRCKLSELVVYCNNSGKVKFTIRNNQNGQSQTMSSNVIKGKSQVILEEFDDLILEPGSSYSLSADSDGSAKIENAEGATMRENPKLKVDNKGSTSFFDIKFRY